MSKENAKEFLKEYRNNEEAMKILAQFPQPKSPDEAIAQLIETAGKLGIRITEEDMAKAGQELKEELKAKTDAAADDLQALDDDDLAETAGGVYYFADPKNGARKKEYDCFKDFTDTSCTFADACWAFTICYYDCPEKYHKKDAEQDCFIDLV